MNSELEKEKKFWLKVDRENKIYQSNKAFAFGGSLILFFAYELVKLCLNYSNFEDFKVAVRSTEKTNSLICFFMILVGIVFIIWGIKIRKSPLSDRPRELP
ncbi:MAG: hypothetical protein WCJ62_05080 [Flavobacterium sp.]